MAEEQRSDHPAPYNDGFLAFVRAQMIEHAPEHLTLLDPMAGTCKLHTLQGEWHAQRSGVDDPDDWWGPFDVTTICSELEPEWTTRSPSRKWGVTITSMDALKLLVMERGVAGRETEHTWLVTSPVWGNRMGDNFVAKDRSDRVTYRHRLGREFTTGSTCPMKWGERYQVWHAAFMRCAYDRAVYGERMLIEIGDHLHAGPDGTKVRAQVTAWWIATALRVGWHLDVAQRIDVPRSRKGSNHDVRIPYIHGLAFTK